MAAVGRAGGRAEPPALGPPSGPPVDIHFPHSPWQCLFLRTRDILLAPLLVHPARRGRRICQRLMSIATLGWAFLSVCMITYLCSTGQNWPSLGLISQSLRFSFNSWTSIFTFTTSSRSVFHSSTIPYYRSISSYHIWYIFVGFLSRSLVGSFFPLSKNCSQSTLTYLLRNVTMSYLVFRSSNPSKFMTLDFFLYLFSFILGAVLFSPFTLHWALSSKSRCLFQRNDHNAAVFFEFGLIYAAYILLKISSYTYLKAIFLFTTI